MNEALLETESISYDVLGSYHDTTQTLSLPYRTGATNTEEPDLRPHPNASSQGDEVAETGWTRLPEVHPATISSDQKRVVKRHIKDGRSHKASKPKNRSPATTSQKLIRIARSQQNPWTMLSPNSAPTASVLPCSLPDSLLKQYLHQIPYTLGEMVSRGASGAEYGKSFAMNVMSSITSSPALLHSIIFAQMLYDRVHQGVHSATPIEVEIGSTAVEHLNREISDPKHLVSESNIWAVVALAYSGRVAVLRSGLKYPHQSFLKELQSIHVYCRMEVVFEHVIGLRMMIEKVGGLQNINTPGIAQMISLWVNLCSNLIFTQPPLLHSRTPSGPFDAFLTFTNARAGIIGACRMVQKPIFPFIPHTTSFFQDGELNVSQAEFEAVSSELGNLGNGFWDVWDVRDVRTPSGMFDFFAVIQHTCDFTVVVENYVRGRWTSRTATEIMDQRNYIQHSLMSLKSSSELRVEDITVDEVHYESARLATIIYSFLVIFPIPPVAGPFETLTRLLRRELEEHVLTDGRPERIHIQLWILMMGCIASIGLPCRPWYLSELAVVVKIAKVDSWQRLQAILQTFLWHPGTNNIDGLDIWDEIEA